MVSFVFVYCYKIKYLINGMLNVIMDLFDRNGTNVAYVYGEDKDIYSIAGKPLGYIFQDAIYSYDGKHIGWFIDGWVRDLQGDCVLFAKDASGVGPLKPFTGFCPYKSFRQFLPFKGFREYKSFKPFFTSNWSKWSVNDLFKDY